MALFKYIYKLNEPTADKALAMPGIRVKAHKVLLSIEGYYVRAKIVSSRAAALSATRPFGQGGRYPTCVCIATLVFS